MKTLKKHNKFTLEDVSLKFNNKNMSVFDKYKQKAIKLNELRVGLKVYKASLLTDYYGEDNVIVDLVLTKSSFMSEYTAWIVSKNTEGKVFTFSLEDVNIVGGNYNPWLMFTNKKYAEEYTPICCKAFKLYQNRDSNCGFTRHFKFNKYFTTKHKVPTLEKYLSLGFRIIPSEELRKLEYNNEM